MKKEIDFMRLPNTEFLRQIMKFNKWLWLKAAIGFTRPGCQKKKNLATSLAVVEVKMVSVFYARHPCCVLI